MRKKLAEIVVVVLSVAISAFLVSAVPADSRQIQSRAGVGESAELLPGLSIKVAPVAVTQGLCAKDFGANPVPCDAEHASRTTEEVYLIVEVELIALQRAAGNVKLAVLSQGKSFGTKEAVLIPDVGYRFNTVAVFLMPARYLAHAQLHVEITSIVTGYYRGVDYDLGLSAARVQELESSIDQPFQLRATEIEVVS